MGRTGRRRGGRCLRGFWSWVIVAGRGPQVAGRGRAWRRANAAARACRQGQPASIRRNAVMNLHYTFIKIVNFIKKNKKLSKFRSYYFIIKLTILINV